MAKSDKKYRVGKSKIQGDGAFAKQTLNPGDYIGKVHTINKLYEDYDFTELGKKHNHSEDPNVQNVLIGNERHLVAIKPIKKGQELTSDYRLQPDLEQPDQDFDKARNGKKAKTGGWLDAYDAPQAQNGIEGTMGGLTDKGFNYNPAWGGAWQNGGKKSRDEKPVSPEGKKKGVYYDKESKSWRWEDYTYFPDKDPRTGQSQGWTKDLDEVTVISNKPKGKTFLDGEFVYDGPTYDIQYDDRGNPIGIVQKPGQIDFEDIRRRGDIGEQTGVPSNEEIQRRSEYKPEPKYYTIEQADPNEEWESEDRRAWGSESRARERREEAIDFMRKASAVGQYVPNPYVMIPSLILNSGIGIGDAYEAHLEGDITSRNLNLAGAVPIPGLKLFNQLRKTPGLNARQKASIMKTGAALLGLDIFGTASDLTDNFGTDKQQNGGILQPPMAGADQTVPMAQNGRSTAMQDFLKMSSARKEFEPSASITPRVDLIGLPERAIVAIPSASLDARPTERLSINANVNAPFIISKEGIDAGENLNYNVGAGYQLNRNNYIGARYGNNQGFGLDYRHTLFNKNKKKEFQMGGSLPGATGMMYARTQGAAPSEGPYAKKTLPSAQEGITFEQRVNKSLGNPMGRAAFFANEIQPGEDFDNARHYMAGALTNKAIQDKTGNIPIISDVLGWVGSNVSGIGHELATMYENRNYDKRPWSTKIRESFEDVVNNAVGATAGSIYNNPRQIEDLFFDLSKRNLLPDGIEDPKGLNLYLKKNKADKGRFGKYINGGEMQFYQAGLDFKPKTISRDGSSVNRADEYPLEKLDNLLNFTNYNKPKAKSGGWLDKYN